MATIEEAKFNPAACQDIICFQDYLKRLRTVDDSIILNLNTTLTTSSTPKDIATNTANCQRFHNQLKEAYESRDKVIQICLAEAEAKVIQLKEAKKLADSDLKVQKELRRQQTIQRMMQKEITVEQIIQDRSLKALQERCRRYVNY